MFIYRCCSKSSRICPTQDVTCLWLIDLKLSINCCLFQDIVYALAHATGRTGRFTLIERWRNNERLLAPQEHPLQVSAHSSTPLISIHIFIHPRNSSTPLISIHIFIHPRNSSIQLYSLLMYIYYYSQYFKYSVFIFHIYSFINTFIPFYLILHSSIFINQFSEAILEKSNFD